MEPKTDVPLTDNHELLAYLQSTLNQLEAASGGVDEEARAALARLRGATQSSSSRPPAPTARTAPLSEAELAAHLEHLETQLGKIEEAIAASSPETQELMAKSAAVWTGRDDPGPPPKDQGTS